MGDRVARLPVELIGHAQPDALRGSAPAVADNPAVAARPTRGLLVYGLGRDEELLGGDGPVLDGALLHRERALLLLLGRRRVLLDWRLLLLLRRLWRLLLQLRSDVALERVAAHHVHLLDPRVVRLAKPRPADEELALAVDDALRHNVVHEGDRLAQLHLITLRLLAHAARIEVDVGVLLAIPAPRLERLEVALAEVAQPPPFAAAVAAHPRVGDFRGGGRGSSRWWLGLRWCRRRSWYTQHQVGFIISRPPRARHGGGTPATANRLDRLPARVAPEDRGGARREI